LDDGIFVTDTIEKSIDTSILVRQDLKAAGFQDNKSKSNWLPVKRAKWLGFILDSSLNIFVVPSEKMEKIQSKITKALAAHFFNARLLSGIIGSIVSLFHAIGNLVYLLTKNCQMWVAERSKWDQYAPLSTDCVYELNFWKENLSCVKTQSFELIVPNITKVIFTDASGHSCGGFIENFQGTELVESWSEDEKLKSSTWRELRALYIFLEVHKKLLCNQQILCYTDNKNLLSIMKKGSMKQELQVLSLKIYSFCVQNCVIFNLSWVPRSQNEAADFLSKIVDIDGWQIDQRIFHFLQSVTKKFTLDPFSSEKNFKCDKFYSKFWCTGTSGVNALCFQWKNEHCWIVPPPVLILQTILHIIQNKASGVLIIPKWNSAAFWPVLYENGSLPSGWSLMHEYEKPKRFFVQGVYANSMFTSAAFSGNVLVFLIQQNTRYLQVYLNPIWFNCLPISVRSHILYRVIYPN
jgi:hypothetical protein